MKARFTVGLHRVPCSGRSATDFLSIALCSSHFLVSLATRCQVVRQLTARRRFPHIMHVHTGKQREALAAFQVAIKWAGNAPIACELQK